LRRCSSKGCWKWTSAISASPTWTASSAGSSGGCTEHNCVRVAPGITEVSRHRLVRYFAQAHVQAVAQVHVVGQSLLPSLVGQRDGERQGGVVQGEGRRAGDR